MRQRARGRPFAITCGAAASSRPPVPTEAGSARRHGVLVHAAALLVLVVSIAGMAPAAAAEFRSVAEPATVLYDAPSAKAKGLFVLGRDLPVEVIVPLERWIKVRDAAGTIGWVEKKALGDRRMLVVRVPLAEVRAAPDDTAPLVFRAEQNVLLEVAEPAVSAVATATPGWVKVAHRDGQTGFVRITQVFGL
jgi:SH3-like domain-containing protein